MNYLKIILPLLLISCANPESIAQIPENPEDICPLLIGETLPNTPLTNSDGKTVQLEDVIKAKPTVLIFYRGGWCPYCSTQLSGLADLEKEILELGYQIVAISPDDFVNLKSTEEKNRLQYQLFADKGGSLIKQTGIAFQATTMTKTFIKTKTKGEVTEFLPVPTVMVVSQKGEILFEYINPNYKQRISSELLLAVLGSLKK